MEKFTSSSEYDRDQAKYHARVIAFGIATGMFALAGLIVIMAYGYYSWLVFGGSILCAMVSWGFTYAIVYVVALPTEPTDWSDVPEREIPEQPPTNNDQPTKHQFTAIFDGRLRIGNSLITIPEAVGEDNIRHIAAVRARGALDNLSLRALDGVGISRNAKNPPNAQTVLAFLTRAGAVDNNGNWTDNGRRYFPSPNDGNNTNIIDAAAFQSSDTAATTAATGQRHYTGRLS